MSGGAFDYQQYHMEEIINRIEEEIHHATKPRPATHKVQFVSVLEIVSEHSAMGIQHHELKELKTLDEVRAVMKKRKRTYKKVKDEGDKIYFTEDGKQRYVYAGEYEDYDDEYDKDGCKVYPYYPDYKEDTIAEFRKAVMLLKQAHIYANRIDYLISGDDGEETFHERLKEELTGFDYETIKE